MLKQGECATTSTTDPSTSSKQGPSVLKLKKIRGGYCGVVTKTFSEARSLLHDENPVTLNYTETHNCQTNFFEVHLMITFCGQVTYFEDKSYFYRKSFIFQAKFYFIRATCFLGQVISPMQRYFCRQVISEDKLCLCRAFLQLLRNNR